MQRPQLSSTRVSSNQQSNPGTQKTKLEASLVWSRPFRVGPVPLRCSQGIGKAIVEELASLGAKVLTCSRTQENVTACIAVRFYPAAERACS